MRASDPRRVSRIGLIAVVCWFGGLTLWACWLTSR